jgi:hypothetical protein
VVGHARQRRLVVDQLGEQAVEGLREMADFVVAHHAQGRERELAAGHAVGLVGGAQQGAQQPHQHEADQHQHPTTAGARCCRMKCCMRATGASASRHGQPRHHEPAADGHRGDGRDLVDALGVARGAAAAVALHGAVVQQVHAQRRGRCEGHRWCPSRPRTCGRAATPPGCRRPGRRARAAGVRAGRRRRGPRCRPAPPPPGRRCCARARPWAAPNGPTRAPPAGAPGWTARPSAPANSGRPRCELPFAVEPVAGGVGHLPGPAGTRG